MGFQTELDFCEVKENKCEIIVLLIPLLFRTNSNNSTLQRLLMQSLFHYQYCPRAETGGSAQSIPTHGLCILPSSHNTNISVAPHG